MREFLNHLNEKSQLTKVSTKINDRSYEISAILDELARKHGNAILFEKLENSEGPLCANLLGTIERLAFALETNKNSLFYEWKKRKESEWPAPLIVPAGPCKESIIKKEDVNLFKYPILKWNPYDGGPYITLGVLISKDPDTNQRNAGIYRLMVQGKNQLGVNVYPRKHIGIHYAKAEAKDKPLEVAVAIGLDPTIILAAATRFKLGQDELAFAGALRNEPVKLVQCHTNSVEVPASAEAILEGTMPPKAREIEGPFGEYTGYYGRAQEMPILRVDAITQRRNPIFQATYTGKPPKEEHVITSLCGPEMERPQGWRGTADKVYRLASSVKRRFMEKPIKLPETDVKKTRDRWREYGLE